MKKTEIITMIQTIQKFMGWENMPANVANDAVRQVVRNNAYNWAESQEEQYSEYAVLEMLYDMIQNSMIEQKDIWIQLFVEDSQTATDIEMHKQATLLRAEIEYFMRKGVAFSEARREWDI